MTKSTVNRNNFSHLEAMTQQGVTVADVVDYPATMYVLIEADQVIDLPEGLQIAVERSRHRGSRMFSSHRVGYSEKQGAYAFALPTILTSEPQDKNLVFVLRFGQRVRVAGKLYTLQDAPNRNVRLVPVTE